MYHISTRENKIEIVLVCLFLSVILFFIIVACTYRYPTYKISIATIQNNKLELYVEVGEIVMIKRYGIWILKRHYPVEKISVEEMLYQEERRQFQKVILNIKLPKQLQVEHMKLKIYYQIKKDTFVTRWFDDWKEGA